MIFSRSRSIDFGPNYNSMPSSLKRVKSIETTSLSEKDASPRMVKNGTMTFPDIINWIKNKEKEKEKDKGKGKDKDESFASEKEDSSHGSELRRSGAMSEDEANGKKKKKSSSAPAKLKRGFKQMWKSKDKEEEKDISTESLDTTRTDDTGNDHSGILDEKYLKKEAENNQKENDQSWQHAQKPIEETEERVGITVVVGKDRGEVENVDMGDEEEGSEKEAEEDALELREANRRRRLEEEEVERERRVQESEIRLNQSERGLLARRRSLRSSRRASSKRMRRKRV